MATSEELDLHKMYKDECVTPKSQSSARQDRPDASPSPAALSLRATPLEGL